MADLKVQQSDGLRGEAAPEHLEGDAGTGRVEGEKRKPHLDVDFLSFSQ